MKRDVEDSQSTTNSPPGHKITGEENENSNPKKRMLFQVDTMKQHTAIAKLEDISSNYNQSNFVSESLTSNGPVTKSVPIIVLDSDDEDVKPQSQTYAHRKPVAEEPAELVLTEVEIIDSGCPPKGNATSVPVNRIIKSERRESKMSRRSAIHVKMDDTRSQVLDDCKGSENCRYDDETHEDGGQKNDVNEKRPETIEECYVENQVEDESQRNLIVGKSTTVCDDIAFDGETNSENDELDDIWKELGLAIENCKGTADFDNSDNYLNKEPTEECEHSLILRDDIGHVCRICGIVQKDIQDIFEFQYKTPRSTRTYKYEPRSKGYKEPFEFSPDDIELPGNKVIPVFSAHPLHAKQMRPHQVEGFNFLARNLISDKPSGCILAHAPGSGKTFMVISFIQSFMATYLDARPLIVLPKGILAIWKTEFVKWQIQNMPLYDLYSSGTESRSQQLEVLRKWVKERSILFLGYVQFSSIVSGGGNSEAAALCQKILSSVPSLLILDEGHTPRNKGTELVNSISRVETRRKVVLSGTLYQNHVQEVFNILDLVQPNFLKSDISRTVAKRIMSRVAMGGVKRTSKGNVASLYDLVERTLQSHDLNIKLHVINDLREMTKDILHYYKGDFLDDLPGLEDFTVILNLNKRQKTETKKLKIYGSVFKRISVGSAIYLHPDLKKYLENVRGNRDKQTAYKDATIDGLIKQVDIKEGVKANFFLSVLRLCEITGEKLLVFSQYLLPLKFLERLTVEVMNWSLGREIFMISGDSSAEMREMSMNQFNNSASARVFFGSIKACGEGISLVGASRIIILDVHLNPSVSRQAVGRAFRPGQKKKVYVYRLIAAESPEEEDHNTCFRKELISKMWFEWNMHCRISDLELKQVDVDDCGDDILESPHIHADVKALYKR